MLTEDYPDRPMERRAKERKHLEFELNRTALSHQKLIFHTQAVREETLEMVVPDAHPDVVRLLDTDGVCCLHSKEASEGAVTLSGKLHCTVLYLPEGEGTLHSLPAELPFQASLEQEGITSDCVVQALPSILSAETRAVNPRKLLLRVSYCLDLRIFRPETMLLPCGVLTSEGEERQVEELQEQAEGYFTIAVPERRFQFRDQLTLPGSQPPMTELLRVQASAGGTEAKLIGGKLVFKGEVLLRALYRSEAGDVLPAEFSLPFSQLMDAPEEEAADFQLETILLNWTLGELSGDGRSVPVEVDLYACARLCVPRTLTLLADAYSVRQTTQPAFRPISFPRLVERTPRRETCRELVETGDRELTILDLRCTVIQTETEISPGQVLCKADVQADLLCVDETGVPEHRSHRLHLESAIPVTGEVEAQVSCVLTERAALPAATGIELRAGVRFQPLLLRREEHLCVTALEVDENQQQEEENRPSIVLRQLGEGESLWDIAKACATTVREIMGANDMEAETTETGRLLLIPHRR